MATSMSQQTGEDSEGDELLSKKFEMLSSRFESLLRELHLPTLDCKLYRRYLLNEVTPDGLSRLSQIVRTLLEHRRRTIMVLAAIQDREAVFLAICHHASLFAEGCESTLEVQTEVLRLLYTLQRSTLTVVEGIKHWRALLTRPFPFMHEGENYLLKILRDYRLLEESSLRTALPLNLTKYPLCSNAPSLSLFRSKAATDHEGGVVTYPLKKATVNRIPATSPAFKVKLRQAELYLGAEFECQLALVKELIDLCVRGYFVPMLNSPLVPNCSTGIRMNSSKWEERLSKALREMLNNLTRPPPIPPALFSCLPKTCDEGCGASPDLSSTTEHSEPQASADGTPPSD